jgi:hypothetical protein
MTGKSLQSQPPVYGIIRSGKQPEKIMSMLHGGWQPISTYDALEVKPRHAVFFFPAIQIDKCSLPEEVNTSRESASRKCTHWHPLQDPSLIGAKETVSPNAGMPGKQLHAKQIAALALLANGKADFHATIKAGANLATMSALVKAGLATALQSGGVKQWQITDLGLAALRETELAN